MNASMATMVSDLVDQGMYAEATELLFGCTREDDPFPENDLHFSFYISLCLGQYPDLLKMMSRHHRWENDRQRIRKDDYGIRVHKRWLAIQEPAASQMLKVLYPGG